MMLDFISDYGESRLFEEIMDKGGDGGEDSSESSNSDSEKEEILAFLQIFRSLETPLQPNSVNENENLNDNFDEFSILLDEAKKSLKRSLSFIGGIVRGYLRRGRKNDKWVEMIRSW